MDPRPDSSAHPPGTRRPGGRSEKVRRAVFAATIDDLATHGLDGLSIPRVAERSGVHMSTIYRRWENPIHLAAAAIVNTVDWSVQDPKSGDLHTDLVRLLAQVAEVAQAPAGRLMLQLAARQNEPGYDLHVSDRLLVTRLAAAEQVMARARQTGELAPDVDPDLLLECLVAPIHMRVLLSHQPVDAAFLERLVEATLGPHRYSSGHIKAGCRASRSRPGAQV